MSTVHKELSRAWKAQRLDNLGACSKRDHRLGRKMALMYIHILLCGVHGVYMEWSVNTPFPALVMAIAHQPSTFPTWSSNNSSSSQLAPE